MKSLVIFALFLSLAFPVFSQDSNQLFRTLSDSMGQTITRSTSRLAAFEERMNINGHTRDFSEFRLRFEALLIALRDSEERMDLLLRSNARFADIQRERDIYQKLIRDLESIKTEYDNWLRNIR